jgi:hypothetical protein
MTNDEQRDPHYGEPGPGDPHYGEGGAGTPDVADPEGAEREAEEHARESGGAAEEKRGGEAGGLASSE